MAFIVGLISLLTFIGFIILCETVKKIKIAQTTTNKLLADINNQMSEQINLARNKQGGN
jgi:hypothetical protein